MSLGAAGGRLFPSGGQHNPTGLHLWGGAARAPSRAAAARAVSKVRAAVSEVRAGSGGSGCATLGT